MIMKSRLLQFLLCTLTLSFPAVAQPQQSKVKLSSNAALRYWSAFAQMQDTSITPEQAKEIQSILDGKAAYSDAKFRDLLERNRPAVETLQRASALTECEWGLEYELGSDAPIEHVRKALALGRLNVLYSFRQLSAGDRTGSIATLAAGIRFSHHVAAGGPLFAALSAKTLLIAHLRALDSAVRTQPLSAPERTTLSAALAEIGPSGVDWPSAIAREFEVLGRSQSAAPASMEALYRKALADAGSLPELERTIANAPPPISNRIPNPRRVLDQERELTKALLRTRTLLGR